MADIKEDSQCNDDCFRCFICSVALKEPFIRCSRCRPVVDICVHCFARGAERGRHRNDHSYEIISNSFPVFEAAWSAEEELRLMDALSDCGYGNWAEVSKQMQTKTEEECRGHYNQCYIKRALTHGLPVLEPPKDARTPTVATWSVPFKVSEDPPRPPMDSVRSIELAGYMPCRGDFEVEYDNYAEFDIKDISFENTNDSSLLTELKIAAVEIFLTRLRERWYRKQIVRRYGLVNIKKWQMLEKRLDRAERELRESMLPFARLQSPEDHEKLIQGLKMENMLKREILCLQEYRMAGIRTKKGAEIFEVLKKRHEEKTRRRKALDDILCHIRDQKACQTWLQRQAALDNGSGLAPIPLPNAARKPASRLDLSGAPGIELLTLDERELCSTLRVLPNDFINYKNLLTRESAKNGGLRLAQARVLVRIDVNKTRKLYNYFVEKGVVIKPDD
ncbi:transcriptional adapter 2-alpha isoform X2 [Nematostella vectensis]|uniref:transcriptional adapter 2-alpha isoform X2 n=1 Tax=Nematostella vectensis TaxID=45351 RepID=UPI0013905500|nr:transcriptional adapter 2-alpha isoform X2 [Nematostella vectensis]